jgi:uncharacterized YigZ family protein
MYSVDKKYSTTTEVKKSKFITYLVTIEEYNSGLIKVLKEQNPKANHIVYSLRYINEHNQIVENSSDDGEPKGSAGVPSLNVLRGKELINCAVLIVRYFGGIKLGRGGMARAYSLATKDVIDSADLLLYQKQIEYIFHTSYSGVDRVGHTLKGLGITQIERDFNADGVEWIVKGNQEQIDEVTNMDREVFKFL